LFEEAPLENQIDPIGFLATIISNVISKHGCLTPKQFCRVDRGNGLIRNKFLANRCDCRHAGWIDPSSCSRNSVWCQGRRVRQGGIQRKRRRDALKKAAGDGIKLQNIRSLRASSGA